MTVFGKLLVFMNLVFSVVTGALIIFVFTTRANWQSAYTDAKVKAEAADAAYRAEKSSHESDLKQKDVAAASVQAEVTRLQADLAKAQDEADRLRGAAATQTNLTNTAATQQKALEEEVKQLKDERQVLVNETGTLRTRIVNMQKEVDDWRNKAVNADLQAKNLVQKNTNLLRQVEDLTVKVRELETSAVTVGTGSTPSSGPSITEPPIRTAPSGVRGKVTAVGASGTSLAQVNIGSDSGLSPGNVLTVYRGTEYKGDLRLTTVEAKSAVGRFTPAKRTSTIEKDDSVITSFSGSPQ